MLYENRRRSSQFALAAMALCTVLFLPGLASASEPETAEKINAIDLTYVLNNAVLFFCAILVLLMQAGFSMVEAGMNSARNVVNILYKNLMDLSIGVLLFFVVGFALMYPAKYFPAETDLNSWLSFGGFGLYAYDAAATDFSCWNDWFFQAVFAATAATIVSGAVAGRMQFGSYLVFSAILTGLVYPISGYWKWGGGWLHQLGFQDFAGSVVVHAVGGFAGLAGAWMLGPRIGRFSAEGKPQAMPGHNLTYAALGVFILWVGWYGFNPGSVLGFGSREGIDAMTRVAVTTTLAAAAGAMVSTIISWIWLRKPDLSISLNGTLGGLVGITGGCDCFSPLMAILVGSIAGALVVGGVVLLEKLRIDDPVGAWPVHGLCGVWGCVSIGCLPNVHLAAGATSLWIQLGGTLAIIAWASLTMGGLFAVLRAVGWLRVSPSEEQAGLDISEHGMTAYPKELTGFAPDQIPLPSPVPTPKKPVPSKPKPKKEPAPTEAKATVEVAAPDTDPSGDGETPEPVVSGA